MTTFRPAASLRLFRDDVLIGVANAATVRMWNEDSSAWAAPFWEVQMDTLMLYAPVIEGEDLYGTVRERLHMLRLECLALLIVERVLDADGGRSEEVGDGSCIGLWCSDHGSTSYSAGGTVIVSGARCSTRLMPVGFEMEVG